MDIASLLGPEPAHLPALRANMVSTLTGSATINDLSEAMGNDTDGELFQALRGWADVVFVGGQTVRSEDYSGVEQHSPDSPPAPIAVPTQSLKFEPDSKFLTHFTTAPLFLVPHAALQNPAVRRAFANSLALAAASGAILAVVAVPLAWLSLTARNRAARVLGWLADAAFVVPGTVLALATILVYLPPLPGLGFSIYGTAAILLLLPTLLGQIRQAVEALPNAVRNGFDFLMARFPEMMEDGGFLRQILSEVTERIRHYEDLGYDEYSFWSDNALTHEEKKASLQLFIDEVVPQFR